MDQFCLPFPFVKRHIRLNMQMPSAEKRCFCESERACPPLPPIGRPQLPPTCRLPLPPTCRLPSPHVASPVVSLSPQHVASLSPQHVAPTHSCRMLDLKIHEVWGMSGATRAVTWARVGSCRILSHPICV